MISLFIVLLSGCGFHLKGVQQTDLKSIYPVYENVSATFRQNFQQALNQNGHDVYDAESADVKIIFLKDVWQRQSLTVSDTGIPVEYRLSCTVSYRFSEKGVENGSEKNRDITESRDFKSNNSQLLANDSQQTHLKFQIQKRISQLIIRNLL